MCLCVYSFFNFSLSLSLSPSFIYLSIIVNLRRFKIIDEKHQSLMYGIFVIATTALVPVAAHFKFPYQSFVLVLIVVILLQEILLYNKSKAKGKKYIASYNHYRVAMVFLILGICCSASDALRIWCQPDNHYYNGHSAW